MNSMQGCFLCLLCKLLATPFGSAKRFGLQNWICCETAMTGRTFPIQNRSGIYNQLVERLHIYSTYTWICLRTQKKPIDWWISHWKRKKISSANPGRTHDKIKTIALHSWWQSVLLKSQSNQIQKRNTRWNPQDDVWQKK